MVKGLLGKLVAIWLVKQLSTFMETEISLPSLDLILNQLNPVQTPTHSFCKTHFNNILPLQICLNMGPLPLKFSGHLTSHSL